MKKLLVTLFTLLSIFSCVDEDPQLDSEKYKAIQKSYEEDKKALNFEKNDFFVKNKSIVEEKINLIADLKDSLKEFKDIPSDSNFILEGEILNNLNFSSLSYSRHKNNKKEAINTIFVNKNGYESTSYMKEPYYKLYDFDFSDTTTKQFGIPEATINTFLKIKYVFILNGFTLSEPSIQDNVNFNSGLYFGSVIVYDMDNRKPLYQYTYMAESSEEINYRKGYGQSGSSAIKNDFTNNINKALISETKKHFNFL